MSGTAPVLIHLVAHDTPEYGIEVLCALRADATLAAAQPVLALDGCGASKRLASRQGQTVRALLPHRWFKAHVLRREVARRGWLSAGRPMIMHAWSREAAEWGRSLAAGHRPLLIDVGLESDLRWVATWTDAPAVGFACPSITAERRLRELGIPAPRIVITPRGLNFAPLDSSRRGPVRSLLGLEAHDTAVLALPPITRQAGGLTVAWATLLLEKVRSDVRLIIPPGGRERQRIRRLVEACRHEYAVRFVPPHVPLPDLLMASDLAVYLPPRDSPTIGLIWGMAAGRFIVATRVPAIAELLRDGETARLCTPDDPADAARAMLAALEDRAETKRRAQHACEQARSAFATAAMIAGYRRAYTNLVARRPAGAAADPCRSS